MQDKFYRFAYFTLSDFCRVYREIELRIRTKFPSSIRSILNILYINDKRRWIKRALHYIFFLIKFKTGKIIYNWTMRYCNMINVFKFFIVKLNLNLGSLQVRRTLILEGSANEEKSWRRRRRRRQALGRWELCASRGQVEMTWNDEACGV